MYREVLLLRDVEGLTAPEVAEVLGLTRAGGEEPAPPRPALGAGARRPAARRRGATCRPRRATCPDVLTMFSRHLEDEISAERCAEMERHLEACAPLPRHLRLAQAHARALPHGGTLGRGPRGRPGLGQEGAPQLPRRERLNPFAPPRLSMIMEAHDGDRAGDRTELRRDRQAGHRPARLLGGLVRAVPRVRADLRGGGGAPSRRRVRQGRHRGGARSRGGIRDPSRSRR